MKLLLLTLFRLIGVRQTSDVSNCYINSHRRYSRLITWRYATAIEKIDKRVEYQNMKKFLVFFLIYVMSSCLSEQAFSQYCPSKIAAISGDNLSVESQSILKEIYTKLGCSVEIVSLPGRRGVLSFNRSLVDGELFRLSLIEKKYEKTFVRSTTPMLQLVNALWEHPSPSVAENKPMAFVLGIAWHEKFISETTGTKAIRFSSDHELVAAYNRGAVGSFLTEKQSINLLHKKRAIHPAPVLKKTISALPLYHYLDKKYAKFMADFSEELRQHQPFQKLE